MLILNYIKRLIINNYTYSGRVLNIWQVELNTARFIKQIIDIMQQQQKNILSSLVNIFLVFNFYIYLIN